MEFSNNTYEDHIPFASSSNPQMQRIASIVERIAPTDLSVLITGETGVGKEVIARQLYVRSSRRQHPFVKINSAAIPDNLIESELFGYKTGAFTGADRNRSGKIEGAHRGTLFFDEIGELTVSAQAKLLHMLQDGEFHSLGSNLTTSVDVRVLAATNRDLYEEVGKGTFREDLFYRLNVVHIDVPPLRDRKQDIPELTEYFLEVHNRQFGRDQNPEIRDEDYSLLQNYPWPGNIRELENFVKTLVLFNDPRTSFAGLRQKTRDLQRKTPASPSLVEMAKMAGYEAERRVIERTLRRNGFNRKRTAQMLHISYRSLLSKIKKMEID